MMVNEGIDYKLAAEQLRTCKPLFGKDGALAPMLERILNAALEGEMDAHLSEESRASGNRRDGKMSKTVQRQYGEVIVAPLVTVMAALILRPSASERRFLQRIWPIRLSVCMPLVRAPGKSSVTSSVSLIPGCLPRPSAQ